MNVDLIVIENWEIYKFSSYEDFLKSMFSKDYFNLDINEKMNLISRKLLCNSINNKNLMNYNYVDEKSFILSLLINNLNFVILENVTANVFASSVDKSNIKHNYILVNTFAKEILENEYHCYSK